jgi:hypothetical protein
VRLQLNILVFCIINELIFMTSEVLTTVIYYIKYVYFILIGILFNNQMDDFSIPGSWSFHILFLFIYNCTVVLCVLFSY